MTLEEMLIRDEGERFKMYQDSVGKWTIGIGHNIEDKGISQRVSRILLEEDIADAVGDLRRNFRWFDALDHTRRIVLINMCFNLGIHRLMGFRKMLAALSEGDFQRAADEMMDSKWASQVGSRANRLEHAMRTGELI